MSVIIRLQNLPWSASAADIRQFFRGLSIPEGGVHIVGGDLGDAFIAFSSDEDARQGMALDGQFIAGARIKLLLSSRSEMQKIIEQARQQALQAVAAASPTYQAAQPVPQAATVSGNLYAAQPAQPPAAPPMQQYPQKTYPDQQGFSNGPRFTGMQNNNGAAPPFAPGGPQRYPYGMGPSYGNPQLNDRNTSSAPAQEEKPYPGRQQPYFERQQPYPDRNQPYPERNQPFPDRNQPYPERNQPYPDRNQPFPERNQPYPDRNQPFPERNQSYPERNQPFPERTQPYPERQQPYFERQGQQLESVMGRRGSREFQDRNGPGGGRADGRDRDSGRRERRRSRERDRDRSQRDGSREKRRGKRSRSRSRSRERARPRRRSSSRDRKTSKDERGGSGGSSAAKPRQGLNSTNPDETKNGSSRESKNAVQFRMLTGDLTYKDIREFFHGIRVPSVGIKMVNGVDGYRFGFAYISFTHNRDKEEAMARNDALIRGSPVQITPVEDSVFEDAIDSFSPGVPLGNFSFDKSCFILRDVPQDVTDVEVAKAFEGFMVKNIVPEMDPNGKPSGIWYVQLASDSEFKRALQMFANGFYIRGLRMKIAVLPLEELNRRLKTLPVTGRKQTNEEPVIPAAFPSRKSRFEPNEGDGRRVNISGLPLSALERDLVDFFSDVGVIPMMIQLKVDKNGAPTGEAFCEFSTFQECQKAVTKNGAFMAGRTITVVLEPGPQPLLSSPEVEEAPAGDFYQATGPGGPRPGPPRQGGPDGPRPRPQRFTGPPRYPAANSQPGFMRPRQPNWPVRPPVGPEMVPDMGGAPRRMPVDPSIPLNGPPMGMPMGPGPGGPIPPGPIVGPGPMPPGPTGGFGAPGCVVALSNVPFKATIDDILNFFSGFPITEKCIIRRFSNTGHPTGDARVALPTPMDAQHAVQTLQGGYIYDRSISLAVL